MSSVAEQAGRKALMPVVYVPHGGGPLPLLGESHHKELIAFLRDLPATLPEPKAILMISAHWENDIASVSSSPHPEMMYDYGGFPPESYQYHYPAPGDPELAQAIADLLAEHDVDSVLNRQRGFDHGTFVPLMLMYPEATIPVVQVSLLRSLDAKSHIALGQALASLREQGVLIIGSGMSSHNSRQTLEDSFVFDNWLTEALVSASVADSKYQLEHWQSAPAARKCHQREEHLLPLHVCLGAASVRSNTAEKVFSGTLFNGIVSGFLWR